MIAVFARQNHPIGYGYGYPGNTHGNAAHGFVVIGVRCRSQDQVRKVIEHIRDEGCDLPDKGRNIYPEGKPKRPYERRMKMYDSDPRPVVRWYSGGPGDWDYLFTVSGDRVDVLEHEGLKDVDVRSLGDKSSRCHLRGPRGA